MIQTATETPHNDSIDFSFDAFQLILTELAAMPKDSWTESDTRIKTIDRILVEVLQWPHPDIATEETAGPGFTDYTLRIGLSARLVVEAKKDAVSFDLDQRTAGQAYKLNGPVFNKDAKKAIDQAIVYCGFKNCELACVTNGNSWIIFRGSRLGDGTDTLDGKGIVFPSLDAIKSNFGLFYSLLSRNKVSEFAYRGEFQVAEGMPLRDLSFLKPLRAPSTRKLTQRGDFATDFDAIMSSFFERLKGDHDAEMIQKCFVVTAESNLAEDKMLRITEDLVGKIRQLDVDTGTELLEVIQSARLQHKNRFVLLVGNKGSGKSTFIDRFFQFVIPRETVGFLAILRVDVALSEGDPQSIVKWLNEKLLAECEAAVFSKAGISWDDCIGKMFFDEYQRWSNGTMSHLYNTDKNQFRIEFGRHVENIRATQPHEYIRRLLSFITKSNKKVPCLVFDNTDHFTIQFQEFVFQYARSIYESELCVVIVPITDKTSWQISRQGALQSFESESLYLPVPAPDRVIERRIAYLLEKLQDKDDSRRANYFLNRGIRLNVKDIGAFASTLNKIFVESAHVSKWIAGFANNDIRRLLELTKDVIASPHLRLEDLLKAYMANSADVVQEHRIKQAIVKKRYDIYPAGEHPYVQNVFSLVLEPPTTPLLPLRVLQFLRSAEQQIDDQDREFVEVPRVTEYFSATGIHPQVTNSCLSALVRTGLILNYDPTLISLDDTSKIEISPSGRTHLLWATTDAEYLQMMKDVTPIRDRKVHDDLHRCFSDYKNRWQESIRLFVQYLLNEDQVWCKLPHHHTYDAQTQLEKDLRRISERMAIAK